MASGHWWPDSLLNIFCLTLKKNTNKNYIFSKKNILPKCLLVARKAIHFHTLYEIDILTLIMRRKGIRHSEGFNARTHVSMCLDKRHVSRKQLKKTTKKHTQTFSVYKLQYATFHITNDCSCSLTIYCNIKRSQHALALDQSIKHFKNSALRTIYEAKKKTTLLQRKHWNCIIFSDSISEIPVAATASSSLLYVGNMYVYNKAHIMWSL